MIQNPCLKELVARGFIAQSSHPELLDAALSQKPQAIYIGYDPTGDSLHVGHLLTLMALKHLQMAGHTIVIILGGGTAKVGDPTGKTHDRPMLQAEVIDRNVLSLVEQISQIIDVRPYEQSMALNEHKGVWLNNDTWLKDINYITFLRDVGRHFSVNRMLGYEAAKARLARGLSFLEFNYILLQSYDFLHLHKHLGVSVQMGGDDQWGNIVSGIDLVRRVTQQQVMGLTVPLLATASGQKMGKTATGAVWLNKARLSPHDYYQYWVNVDDSDTVRFMLLYTMLGVDEVKAFAVAAADPAIMRGGKRVLAFETCALLHGEAMATQAHLAAQAAFGGHDLPQHLLPSHRRPKKTSSTDGFITHAVSAELLHEGLSMAALLVTLGFARGHNEARRLIAQKAVKMGDVVVDDVHFCMFARDVAATGTLVRAGKKRVVKIVQG